MQTVEDVKMRMINLVESQIEELSKQNIENEAYAFLHSIKGVLHAIVMSKLVDMNDQVITGLYDKLDIARKKAEQNIKKISLTNP